MKLAQLQAVRTAIERAALDARPAKLGGGGSFRWEESAARGDRITWLKPPPRDQSNNSPAPSSQSDDATSISERRTIKDDRVDAGIPLLIHRLQGVRAALLASGADVAGPYSLQLAVYPGDGARYLRHRDASETW